MVYLVSGVGVVHAVIFNVCGKRREKMRHNMINISIIYMLCAYLSCNLFFFSSLFAGENDSYNINWLYGLFFRSYIRICGHK